MSRLEQLQKLAALMPNDPLSHYGLGLEYLNQQRWDAARDAFARTLACDANYSAAYYHKARAEINAGQPEAARATLSRGMEAATTKGDWKTKSEMQELLESIA